MAPADSVTSSPSPGWLAGGRATAAQGRFKLPDRHPAAGLHHHATQHAAPPGQATALSLPALLGPSAPAFAAPGDDDALSRRRRGCSALCALLSRNGKRENRFSPQGVKRPPPGKDAASGGVAARRSLAATRASSCIEGASQQPELISPHAHKGTLRRRASLQAPIPPICLRLLASRHSGGGRPH